jgi:hypothetical protein
VSSLTRDLSPASSRRDESASPLSLRSEPMRSTESPARTKEVLKAAGSQISSGTQTSPDSSKESIVPKEPAEQESLEDAGASSNIPNGGEDEVIPKSSSNVSSPSKRSSRKSERNRTRSPAGTSHKGSSSSKRRGVYEEKAPVKEAMSPSVAESIRSGNNRIEEFRILLNHHSLS